jgi:hypothetical protein
MTFNEIARNHLQGFEQGEAPSNGMAHFAELRELSLDGSRESLARLDGFLLELHAAGYADEIDLDDEASQNFLYFAAFYLGRMAGGLAGVDANWITWAALVEANPGLADEIPEVFGSSVLCVLGKVLYIPLSVVMARLYEGAEAEALPESVEAIVRGARSAP